MVLLTPTGFLAVVFLVAWLLPLLLVWHYCHYRVPVRLAEITASFLRKDPASPARLRPVEHYVRLFIVPGFDPAQVQQESDWEACIRRQFTRHHAGERYMQAIFVLAVVSGLALFAIWARVVEFNGFACFFSEETVYALAGAYVWSLYEIQLRRSTNDLTPLELFWTDLRYLAAVPIGFCVALLATDVAHPAVAFGITALPINDIRRLFRKKALERIGVGALGADGPPDGLLTAVVEGIDLDAVTRLEELQITTYSSLAYADPIRLMAKTGYPLRLIVQWIDHALLAIYAPRLKRKLAGAGLPCSLDAKEFFITHFAEEAPVTGGGMSCQPRDYRQCPVVASLAKRLDLDATLLGEIFQRVWSDPHVVFLDTLWYTGYPDKGQRLLPGCPYHKPLS
jgi:hypothetical protein